jgi:isoleucyl-tRNA synthetase
LLGALEGFGEDERVEDVAEMPELERYMLSLLAGLDATLRQAVADFDFNSYVRALTDFCNNDLSAFYFDIRKDTLYCEVNAETGFQTDKRRAYRTVLDTIFEALVRYAAPVLVFTSEEVWGTRWPDKGSVHLLEWPDIGAWRNVSLERKWLLLRRIREAANAAAEIARRDKLIGSTLEAEIALILTDPEDRSTLDAHLNALNSLSELLISGNAYIMQASNFDIREVAWVVPGRIGAVAFKTKESKCGRCWRHLPEVVEDGDLCGRCAEVVHAS